MTATITRLPAIRTPLGHAIRTGEAWFRKLEHLHAKGRLQADTVIVDASKARFQMEFIRALKDEGAEIILDTKAAELSEEAKFGSLLKDFPWAALKQGRLEPRDYEAGATIDFFGNIARLAVELGVTAVLAPTHFLRQGAMSTWLPIDRRSVGLLRAALDRTGGSQVAIDYPLILPHTRIQREEEALQIMRSLRGLPIDNLYVRLSGFGADARPLAIKRTLIALQQFHALGNPIVLDYVGGLVGLSALAFGVVSGIAHGIGERERFDARSWHKPPKARDPNARFGRSIYIPVSGMDKSFRKRDLEVIANSTRGRRLVACGDRQCCPNGLSSMISNPRAHTSRQRLLAVENLFQVPDALRISHFLSQDMDGARRKASELARLRTGKEKLDNVLRAKKETIEQMIGMYETLAERDRPSPPAVIRRNGFPMPAKGRSS